MCYVKLGAKEGEDLIGYLEGWLCRRLRSDLSIAVESYPHTNKKPPPPPISFTLLSAEIVDLILKGNKEMRADLKEQIKGRKKI